MLAKRIIPCLGVANGRVQNGVQFRDMVDAGDPVECAERYEIQGADELVLLDITATTEARKTFTDIVQRHYLIHPLSQKGQRSLAIKA